MSLWILIVLALAAAAIIGLVALRRVRAKAARSASHRPGPAKPPTRTMDDAGSSGQAAARAERAARAARAALRRRSQASGAEPPPEPPLISREESAPEPPPPTPPQDPEDEWRRGARSLSVEEEPGRSGTVRSPRASFAARFYAFHPQEVAPGAWFRLLAYAARAGAEDAVRADLERVAERPQDLRQLRAKASRPIAEGAPITVTPRAEGVEFNPPRLELAFLRDLHRFDFDGRADASRAGGVAVGEVVFSVAGLVIGAMPLAIYVAAAGMEEAPPLRFQRVERAAYRKIFPSYSHSDTQVVRRVERAWRALGDTTLRDAMALRSGEVWNRRLYELIEEADLFQLFWSPAAAESRYVFEEWTHAVALVEARDKEEGFIRPVYWREPLTPPKLPAALARLHFHFDPDLDEAPPAPGGP